MTAYRFNDVAFESVMFCIALHTDVPTEYHDKRVSISQQKSAWLWGFAGLAGYLRHAANFKMISLIATCCASVYMHYSSNVLVPTCTLTVHCWEADSKP